jgi:acetyl esterase/lipase
MARFSTLPHNPSLEGLVDLKTHIVYAAPGGEELAMQLLKPLWSSGGKGFPLVVFIQGSAWTQPNQFWEIPQLSLLARRGFVVASVTHRSCYTACAPAFLQDVKAALRFLRAHAAAYDIDKTRVCAWGTSSGGNTALLLGLTGDEARFETAEWAGESTRVQAVVDCFGPTDLNKMVQVQFRDTPEEEKALLYALGGAQTAEACADTLRAISPIQYAQPGKDYPPFLLLHGDADPLVLYEDTQTFYDRMNKCGYDMELVCVQGAPHEGSFWSLPLLEKIFGFIQAKIGSGCTQPCRGGSDDGSNPAGAHQRAGSEA